MTTDDLAAIAAGLRCRDRRRRAWAADVVVDLGLLDEVFLARVLDELTATEPEMRALIAARGHVACFGADRTVGVDLEDLEGVDDPQGLAEVLQERLEAAAQRAISPTWRAWTVWGAAA